MSETLSKQAGESTVGAKKARKARSEHGDIGELALTFEPGLLVLIQHEGLRAAARMGRPSPLATQQSSSPPTVASSEDVKTMSRLVRKHHENLESLSRRAADKRRNAIAESARTIMKSFSGRVSALLRATPEHADRLTLEKLEQLASQMDPMKPCMEPLTLTVYPKRNGGERYILKGGRIRRAMQILLRDVLIAAGLNNEFEYARKFRGPRVAAERMKNAIADGYQHWLVCDIKNSFPSQKPGHFGWMPIPATIRRNVAFTPQDAPIKVGLSLSNGTGLTKAARQGLPVGSMVSFQMASALLGRELRRLPGDWVAISHGDDIALGARNPKDLNAIEKALKDRLANLEAGPLILRFSQRYDAEHFVEFMQFKFRWKQMLEDPEPFLHRSPSRNAFIRWENELLRRIKSYPPDADHNVIVEDLLEYSHRWMKGVDWLPADADADRRELVEIDIDMKVRTMVDDLLVQKLPEVIAGKLGGFEMAFKLVKLD